MKLLAIVFFSLFMFACGDQEGEVRYKVDVPNDKGEYIFTMRMAKEGVDKCYSNYNLGSDPINCKGNNKLQYCEMVRILDSYDNEEEEKKIIYGDIYVVFLYSILQVTGYKIYASTDQELINLVCEFGKDEFDYPYKECKEFSDLPYVDPNLIENVVDRCSLVPRGIKVVPN